MITRVSDTSTRNASERSTYSTVGREMNIHARITQAVHSNMGFTSENPMACDVFVTQVLLTARIKPKDWPDPQLDNSKGVQELYEKQFEVNCIKGLEYCCDD